MHPYVIALREKCMVPKNKEQIQTSRAISVVMFIPEILLKVHLNNYSVYNSSMNRHHKGHRSVEL